MKDKQLNSLEYYVQRTQDEMKKDLLLSLSLCNHWNFSCNEIGGYPISLQGNI